MDMEKRNKQEDPLFRKLGELDDRYSLICRQLEDPGIAADPAKAVELNRAQGRLKAVVESWRRYKQVQEGLDDAGRVLADPEVEEDFRALAVEEIGRLEEKKRDILDRIKDALVASDTASVDSVIVEIRAGTGGEEAALFARDLHGMYARYAQNRRWKVEQISFAPTEMGGFREVIFGVKGPGVWSDLAYESGGHRVQRVPQTESQGRIHTSAATVAVLPEPRQIDIEIDPSDVVEHVSRAGGPGGQNVNKVSSAIRLEHRPTGITVSMRDEKSQHKNRDKAWRILKSRLYDYHRAKQRARQDSRRRSLIGTGDRSEKIRTYNFPQNRVTDHRINLSLYNLEKIMTGELDELIAALKDYDKRQILANL
jgi:peptide chain release factor 1